MRPKLQRGGHRLICSAGRAAQLEKRRRERESTAVGDAHPILTGFSPPRLLPWRGGDARNAQCCVIRYRVMNLCLYSDVILRGVIAAMQSHYTLAVIMAITMPRAASNRRQLHAVSPLCTVEQLKVNIKQYGGFAKNEPSFASAPCLAYSRRYLARDNESLHYMHSISSLDFQEPHLP